MVCLTELTIDLSDVPLTPFGAREEQKLEAALIVGTLYSPEVVELLKDPVEKTTWLESLAVAAAAFAKYKAGKPVSKIAEEVGRSEQTVRAHIQGKTKAGKLVISTYEKLKSGTLKLVVPFSGELQITGVKEGSEKEKEELARKATELEKKVSELQGEVERLRKELDACRESNNKLTSLIELVRSKLQQLEELKQALSQV
ncbi:MAG: transcriptional regulator [Thermogladius sp.]|nr:transcriptional regulator [Thermogladius sp.]